MRVTHLLLPDQFSDAKQGHKAGDQEGDSDEQVAKRGRHHKHAQLMRTHISDGADARERIGLDQRHRQHGTGLRERQEPRDRMEVDIVLGNRFTAPFQAGCQEPRERND